MAEFNICKDKLNLLFDNTISTTMCMKLAMRIDYCDLALVGLPVNYCKAL